MDLETKDENVSFYKPLTCSDMSPSRVKLGMRCRCKGFLFRKKETPDFELSQQCFNYCAVSCIWGSWLFFSAYLSTTVRTLWPLCFSMCSKKMWTFYFSFWVWSIQSVLQSQDGAVELRYASSEAAVWVHGGIFSGRLHSDIYCSVLHASFIVLIILCVILMQHLKGTVLIMLYISGGICYHKRRCWNNFWWAVIFEIYTVFRM